MKNINSGQMNMMNQYVMPAQVNEGSDEQDEDVSPQQMHENELAGEAEYQNDDVDEEYEDDFNNEMADNYSSDNNKLLQMSNH